MDLWIWREAGGRQGGKEGEKEGGKIRWCFRREGLTFAKISSEKIAVYETWSADVPVFTRVIF